jgi:phenylpyruvate tautomerase PptA (4-oxalocrotonate tautomerase family)
MPVYQVLTSEELLSDDQRQEIAQGITEIHTTHTGAPRQFVNVVFLDSPSGRMFTAGEPSTQSVIGGTIREGRTIEMRQAMLRDYSDMWVRVTGQSSAEVLIGLQEIDARAAMEVGLIMPGPGEEAEWFEQNRDRLKELGIVGD